MGAIATAAQDTSLGNVRTLLNEYNSGLANCGLTQEQFIQSVTQSNRNLGYYFTSLQGGEATMSGYVGTLISAKLATIGLRISTMALNAVIGMGIGLVISLVSSGIMKLIEYAKENARPLAEKLADVNSELKEIAQNIKDISDEYRDLKASTDEIIPRFAELADGVDRFGKNVSLTDEGLDRMNCSRQESTQALPLSSWLAIVLSSGKLNDSKRFICVIKELVT